MGLDLVSRVQSDSYVSAHPQNGGRQIRAGQFFYPYLYVKYVLVMLLIYNLISIDSDDYITPGCMVQRKS
jgi:hypothetical protein